MSVFDPQIQILASLQQYADCALDELHGIAGNNIEKWKVGLRDIQNWDDTIIGEEVASLLELDFNIMQLLYEIVHEPPELSEFLHVFMIELSKVSCVRNKEYFVKFGHVDRSNVQKSVLTRVFRKLALRPKLKEPPSLASLAPVSPSTTSKAPSKAASKCSKKDSRSCTSRQSKAQKLTAIYNNNLNQILEDQTISLAPSDSVSCLPKQNTPSVVKEESVAKSRISKQSQMNQMNQMNHRDTTPGVPENREISIASEIPDFQRGPMFLQTKKNDLSSFASMRSKTQSTVSSRFPSAQPKPHNDMMSGVSLIR